MRGPTRISWLKAMYVANIVIAAPLGAGALAAPGAVRALLGIPPGGPLFFGIAAGAVPLAFGLAGVAGLRAPLRLSPVLALQALYKALFLASVIAPLAAKGQMPGHAVPLIVIFVFFIVGDVVAVPFRYLTSRTPDLEEPGQARNAQGEGAVATERP